MQASEQEIRWGGLSPVDLGTQAIAYAQGYEDPVAFGVFCVDYFRDESDPFHMNFHTAWNAFLFSLHTVKVS